MSYFAIPKRLFVLFAIPVILFLGFLIWVFSLNAHANRQASNFCKSISIGEPISKVIDRANLANITNFKDESKGKYFFIFQGFASCHPSCSVEVNDDKVVGKAYLPDRD